MSLTTTEAALLGLLRKRPMSGYNLRKEVEKSVAYFWAPAKTQIYATLPKRVEAGYASEEKVVQETRPDKRIYAITDAGREALREWIEDAPLDVIRWTKEAERELERLAPRRRAARRA